MTKTLIVKWIVNGSETARVEALLPELAEKTRAEKGNVAYTIYRSETDPNTFVLHESYTDAQAAEAHRQSEHYQRIVAKQILPHLAVREVIAVTKML